MTLAMRAALAAVAALVLLASSPAHAEDPWLGVVIRDSIGPRGALVDEVIPGTPADDAGIVKGDVITRVGATVVRSANLLIGAVKVLKVGAEIDVKVVRAGSFVDMQTTLTARLTEDEILKRRLLDQPMPAFSLAVISGTLSGDSADHRGDVMLVFFASPRCVAHCAAVRTGIEAMRVVSEKNGLVALSVMPGHVSAASLRSLNVKTGGITMLRDGYGDALRVKKLRALGLPTLLVVDRRGFIRYAAMGSDIDLEDVQFAVTRSLGKTASR